MGIVMKENRDEDKPQTLQIVVSLLFIAFMLAYWLAWKLDGFVTRSEGSANGTTEVIALVEPSERGQKARSMDMGVVGLRSRVAATDARPRPAVPGGPLLRRSGIAFAVTSHPELRRLNISLLTSYWIPPQVWSDPTFLADIQAQNGTFPVHIWRMRGETVAKVEDIHLPAYQGAFQQYAVRAPKWEQGDIVVIETNPGLFVANSSDGSRLAVPIGSEVDNISGDPVTVNGVLVEFIQNEY